MDNNSIDEPGGDGAYADVAARLRATLGAPALDPAVRQRHLQAIRDRAAALPTPAPVYAPSPAPARTASRWARRLASGVTAAGLVAVMGASGAVAASHGSLPGDALHPVKEVTERLVLAASLPTGLAVDRLLSFADRRLDEAEALVDRDGDPALVAETIAAHAGLLERAGDLAHDDRGLSSRVGAANLVARGRLAHLLDAGLPEVAAHQARAALAAGQERLDPSPAAQPATPPAVSPAAPQATPPARPAPPTDPAEPGTVQPDPPSPAAPPDRTPAPGAPTPPSPPGRPAESGMPGPSDQPDERRPSSQSSSQPRPATPPQQRPPPDSEGAPSGPAEDRGAPSNGQLVRQPDGLRLG